MKYVRLAILLLLIPLCCVVFAALVKTTTLVELDAWQKVPFGTLTVGNAGNISGSYETIIYLEIAYADDDSQEGVKVSVEVSYGDDDWTLLTKPFTTPVEISPESTTLDGLADTGATVISLISSTGFNLIGLKWFIEDPTAQDSESVRTKSASVNDITLCHDIMTEHTTGSSVWEIVHEYIIPIPAGFAYVRVLIDNVDIDADIFYTIRISKVTSL